MRTTVHLRRKHRVDRRMGSGPSRRPQARVAEQLGVSLVEDPSSRLHAIAHCAHHVPHLAALGPITGAEVRRRQSGIRYDLPPIAGLAA